MVVNGLRFDYQVMGSRYFFYKSLRQSEVLLAALKPGSGGLRARFPKFPNKDKKKKQKQSKNVATYNIV